MDALPLVDGIMWPAEVNPATGKFEVDRRTAVAILTLLGYINTQYLKCGPVQE